MWEIQRFEAVGAWQEDLGEGIGRRLKHVTKGDENQFSFMAGKSTTGAIFIIRQLQELTVRITCLSFTLLIVLGI